MKKKAGFTLVELLISISIVGLISAIGLASYIDYNRNQIVVQEAKKVVQDLRLAQSLALNNQKPEGCGQATLDGYAFRLLDDDPEGYNYEILALCGEDEVSYKRGAIAENLAISGPSEVKFKVLRQGIEFTGGSTITVSSSSFSQSRTITIDPGGDINVGE
jgi:prepilin-type N-terminal cleavage/methylation domain-containing protein